MISVATKRILAARSLYKNQARAFSNDSFFSNLKTKIENMIGGETAMDIEQQGGLRYQELKAAEQGETLINRDPMIPADDAGTKENPILIPSGLSSRVVGFEDPVYHQMLWFEVNQGPLHYVPRLGLYFKLTPFKAVA